MTKKPEQIYSELLTAGRIEKSKVPKYLKKELSRKLNQVSAIKRNKFSRFLKPVLSVAASLIIISVLCLVLFNSETGKNERYLIHESTVAGNVPLTIKLVYESADDLKNVKFSLDLDEGVSFYSENPEIKSRKSHEWTGGLKKGTNSIPFVVETSRLGKMKILARARSGKFSHTQEIVLFAKEKETVISMFSISADN